MSEATLKEKLDALLVRVDRLEAERSARPVSSQPPWRALTVDIESAATVGTVLRADAGAWAAAGIDAREACAIVTAQVDGIATLTLWGQWAAAGTVGTTYYPGAAGALVTDVTVNHQAWPIAWQVTPTMRMVCGLLPRLVAQAVTVCADLGEGAVETTAWIPIELPEG